MTDGTIEADGGRVVGFADHGPIGSDETVVIWCHGGPGSRLEPDRTRAQATTAGLRIVGIDRPGYGLSTPSPGRTIADWVPDALAVADHLGIERFVTVGHSTGGAYALAVAALAPERTIGVVACGAMTDMRDEACRSSMSRPHVLDVWDAPDRDAAMAAATASHGPHGEGLREITTILPPSDLALFIDPASLAEMTAAMPAMFAFGLEGYTDDRLADGGGWTTFDVSAIKSPVTVLHGGRDPLAVVAHAEHTASIVPGAVLEIVDDAGHFSIFDEVVAAIGRLLARR